MQIEADAAAQVVQRLRRARGQIDGIITMIEAGRSCQEIVTQVAAASKALDRAGFTLVAAGLRQCLSTEADQDSHMTTAELERLFLSLS